MKDKVILIVMIVSLAFNLGVLTMFVLKVIFHPRLEQPIEKVMKQRLDLTREQEEKFKEIWDETHDEIKPLREEMEKKRREAFNLLQEPEMDIEKRDQLFTESAELQIQIEMLMFNHIHSMKDELTPEQQEIFMETMEERICPKGGPMGPPGSGRGSGGFHRKNMRGPIDKKFKERIRREHHEEMEKKFKHAPDDSPDSREPGDNG